MSPDELPDHELRALVLKALDGREVPFLHTALLRRFFLTDEGVEAMREVLSGARPGAPLQEGSVS